MKKLMLLILNVLFSIVPNKTNFVKKFSKDHNQSKKISNLAFDFFKESNVLRHKNKKMYEIYYASLYNSSFKKNSIQMKL